MKHSGNRFLPAGLAFLILSLLCPSFLSSAPASADRHCLWKVQGPATTVYLLGSIHFLKKDYYPLADPIEKAYDQATVVVFEADMENMMNPATLMKLAAAGMYPPGETLSANLSKETYAALEARLQDGIGSVSALDTLRPWMVAVTLLGVELQRMGFSPTDGVDQYFHGKAKEDGKKTGSLETVEDQINLFTGLSREEEEAFLKTTLEDLEQATKLIHEMVGAWKNGDTATLDKFLNEVSRESPAFHAKFVTNRNRQWLSGIEQYLRGNQPVLVVVGAGHLVGPDSVVDLLRQKGYSVEQK